MNSKSLSLKAQSVAASQLVNMLRSPQEYRESLVDGREVYYRGERVRDVTRHPFLSVAANHAALLYEMQQDPSLRALLVDENNEIGQPISSFYSLPRNTEELLSRSRIIEETTRRSHGVFNIVKAIGSDAIMALMILAKAMDSRLNTHYTERVEKYYQHVARNDLALAVAQTDVKGDRRLRPSEQADPDLYLRVVEVRGEGLVVRGAKVHTTQAIVSNEIIVLPTRVMVEADQDYAVAFALPASSKNLKMISRPLIEVEASKSVEEGPLSKMSDEVESLTIFDNVFVPWERVFLFREWQFAGYLANLFALYHRFTAISYRQVIAEILLGAARLMAEYNGIEDAGHVREKLGRLIMYRELQRMSLKAAAFEAVNDEATGLAIPSTLYTNIGKLYSNTAYLQAIQALIDIAGGLVATAPSPEDYSNKDLKPYIDKYLAAKAGKPADERFKLFLLIREITGLMGSLLNTTMIHAEGSIEASIIALNREYDYRSAKALVGTILREE